MSHSVSSMNASSPMNKLVTKRLSMPTMNFTRRGFDSLDINSGIDLLTYGLPIKIITKKAWKSPKTKIFFICEDDVTLLQWVSVNKTLQKNTIELKTVTHISENPTSVKSKVYQNCDPTLLLSIHHGKSDELVLLFDDMGTKMSWWCGLQYFIEDAQNEEKDLAVTTNILIREMFLKADTDGTKTLDKGEVKELLKSLQIYMRNKEINQIFEKYDADKNKKIDMQEFESFVIEMTRKMELLPLYRKYAGLYVEGEYQEPSMTLFELLKFFNVEQNQIITLETLRKLSDSFAHISATKPCISFDFFGVIIFSSRNTIFNSDMSYIYQDMTKPLTDYYINTSHNTYLMSNQLTGESSVHAYINALKKGCRCVELDIWTGSNSVPIIYHGHTMTSKILFEDVIKALKEHAFTMSTYPLILSFEMHCDINTQKNLVAILKRVLGDMIYSVPDNFDTFEFYPSPEELQRKFIIKGKGKLIQKDRPDQEQGSHGGNFSGSDVSVDNPDVISMAEDSMDSLGDLSERLNSHRRESLWHRTVTGKSPRKQCNKARKGEKCQCCLRDIDEYSIEYEDITQADQTPQRNVSSRVLGLNSTSVSKLKKNYPELDELTMTRQISQQSQFSMKIKKPKISLITANSGDTWFGIKGMKADSQGDIETARGFTPKAINYKVTIDLNKVLEDNEINNGGALRRASVQSVGLRASAVKTNPGRRSRKRNITSPASPFASGFKEAIHYRSVVNVSSTSTPTKIAPKTTTFAHSNKPVNIKTERMKPILGGVDGMTGTYSYSIRGMLEHTAEDLKSVKKKNSMKKKKSIKLRPELNALFGMIGKHMSLEDIFRKVWEISSVNENKIAKFYKTNHKEIVNFHKKFLSRIYPNASRIDSSNFDPVTSWASGSQLVALNFQKSDEFMLLNYAKFANNGGIQSGYTLKPEYMCHDALINHEIVKYPNDFKKPIKKLSVKIISGQQIRPDDLVVREIIDPYVEVKIRGLDVDEERNQTFKTHMIKDNGFHPVWDSNTFEFEICAPDFCFLVITAYHGDVLRRDRMGWYAIELNCMQQGYRVVPLLNNIFQPIKGSYVFCKVTITDI